MPKPPLVPGPRALGIKAGGGLRAKGPSGLGAEGLGFSLDRLVIKPVAVYEDLPKEEVKNKY